MTTFTAEQIKYLETKIDFIDKGDVGQGFSVRGDVGGNVWGSVKGRVKGSVWGDVLGDVLGSVGGDVLGDVLGSVGGGVKGINSTDTEYVRVDIAPPLADPRVKALQDKARAVVDRWDSPLWKDLRHTGTHINELRDAISALEENK